MIDYSKFIRIINKLKMIDPKLRSSYSIIEKLTRIVLKNVPFPGTFLSPGIFLLRCRLNRSINYFENIADLSFRKDINNITSFGRANEPNQSVFYASTTRPTAVIETLYQYNPDFETETVTIGVWKIIKHLILASFCHAEHQEYLEDIWQSLKFPKKNLIAGTKGSEREFFKNFLDFYANKLSLQVKDPNDYKFTAALANAIFSYSHCDGLMYDSVKLADCNIVLHNVKPRHVSLIDQIGLDLGIARIADNTNVALRTDAIADKLVFHDAMRFTVNKIGPCEYFATGTQNAIGFSEGKIYWGD